MWLSGPKVPPSLPTVTTFYQTYDLKVKKKVVKSFWDEYRILVSKGEYFSERLSCIRVD